MPRCDSEEYGKELCRRAGAIETLTDDVLLDIFSFYRDRLKKFPGRPWRWHTLVHVCRRWRHIVFSSPRRLDLQLLCTVGVPVREYLDCWPPTLSIAINYRLHWDSQPSSGAEDNLIAALENPERVCSIELVATSSFLEKISSVMQESFPALTNLWLWSADIGATVPIIPQGFLGESTRLKKITLGSISFPALPKLLLSCRDLVNLHLMEIPNSGYISPEAMVASLSSLSRLKTLEIGFSSPRSCSGRRPPPPLTRSTISALTEFTFKGSNEYLEDLVARMDTPSLHEFYILFFHQLIFDVPQLSQFICRTEGLGSPDKATMISSEIAVSLRLWRVGRSAGSPPVVRSFSLNIPYKDLDWQVSSVAQICLQSLSFLSGVKRLSIDSTTEQLGSQDDVGPAEWHRLFRSFTAVEALYVSEPLGSQVALALASATGQAEILPALRSTSFKEPLGFTSVPDIVEPSPPPAGLPIPP
ncbi:hypothetical protein H4582DRAFT_1958697 [Lactarius indigo]|nr:hypothetical protein H4582DRAFT_1958697 [Lactarius indigo]